jgi:hypothetical protein
VALGGAADGGVARHLPDGVQVHRQQQGARPHARGGQRRLAARVPGAHHDHVVLSHHA